MNVPQADDTNCSCKSYARRPSDHAIDCTFRLKYDEITAAIDFSEQELLGALRILERLYMLDSQTYEDCHGVELLQKVMGGVKVIAETRSTGAMPDGAREIGDA